ncbi:MAG: ATP-binding cassette domain-containing protein [Alphaproteobacteria bacterium]|nr:ATP-binding cassette domain-containing protein [Alphaproteobacteria bacterium]
MLETENLAVHFGGHAAVDGVTCRFEPGTLTSIVGPNGAGKTTYFNLVSGQLAATEGRVLLDGNDVTALGAARRSRLGFGRAFQLTNLFPNLSVLENVRLAVQVRHGRPLDLFSRVRSHRELTERAMAHLESVALGARAQAAAAALPHGDQRKLEVAILLALEPKIFMFDEPTAGMSIDEVPTILDIIAAIKRRGDRTILLVEHKMDVVRQLSDRIVVLHQGKLVADGPPAEIIRSDIVREAYLGGASA